MFRVLAPLVGFGLLSSASSMLIVGIPQHIWISHDRVVRSTWAVLRRLAVYCALSLAFAVTGYMLVSAGHTLNVKLN